MNVWSNIAATPNAVTVEQFAEGRSVFVKALADEARIRDGDESVVARSVEHAAEVLNEVADLRATVPLPDIESPVVVIGMLRTGTTLLHNLLNLHPRMHGPALWELAEPGVAGGDPGDHDVAVATAQAYVDEYNAKAPDLAAIHYLRADRPDECHRLLANTFHSMVLEMRYRVPSYGEWLRRQDLRPAYRTHRAQLEVLMRHRVDAQGRPLTPVLKCPFHAWFLPALVAAYPRARFVHLHRDPVEVVASTASLCRAVRVARTDHVDLAEIGELWRGRIASLSAALATDRDELVGFRPVLDIRYQDLVADPIRAVGQVCAFLELDFDHDFQSEVTRYLAENGKHRHGIHRYTPAEFDIDAGRLADSTERYSRRFAL